MSSMMRDLERAIWTEAKSVFNNPKIRLKDIQEWTNGQPKLLDDESAAPVNVFGTQFTVVIKKNLDLR